MSEADVRQDDLAQIEEGADGSAVVNLDKKPEGAQGRADDRRQRAEDRAGEKPVDDNVAAMKAQLAAERQRRVAAENSAQQAEARRQQTERQSSSGQLGMLEGSIIATTREKDGIKAELSAAYAAAAYDKIADIQERLNDSQIRLRDMVAGRDALKQRQEHERASGGRVPEPQRQMHADPVEQFIADSRVTQRSADWLREHPEAITDPRMQRQVSRAHEDAIYEGIAPDTRAYFDFIEQKLGLGDGAQQRGQERGQGNGQGAGRGAEDRGRDAASGYAAPPSRSGNGSGRGSGGNQVNLSPPKSEFARESGITLEAYARNKQALQREGKLK